jgi:hypothetical protein
LKKLTGYFTGSRRISYILGALVVLVISDGLISNYLIGRGLAWESNPFLQTLVGGGPFLLIKIVGVLVSALILWDIYRHWPKLGLISSLCFVGLYTGILFWNVCVFFIAQV